MNTRTFQLRQLCDFIRGVTFDKSDIVYRPEPGRTPILRAGNISDELDVQNDLVWVPDTRVSAEQRLREYDIAICMSSGSPEVVGKTARVKTNLHASVGSFCGIIRAKNANEASYLSYFFRSQAFRKHRDSIARGANIQNLRISQMEEITISLPAEQEQIADQLEQVDRLRHQRRYAVELSDTFLSAAFLDLFGDPGQKPIWPLTPFGELISVGPQNGLYKPASEYGSGTRIVRIDGYQSGGTIAFRHLKRLQLSSEEIATYGLSPGDFLINRVNSRSHLGKSTLIPHLSEPTVFESNMMRFRVKEPELVPIYVLQFLQTRFLNAQIQKQAKDASNQSSINQEDVQGFTILHPPLRVQQRFASIVARHERVRSIQAEALRQADHLFQSLLHDAFETEV